MNLELILARTPAGNAALFNAQAPISSAFKHLLTAMDGLRPLKVLLAKWPQLREDDFKLWVSQLIDLHYVREAAVEAEAPSESGYVYEGYVQMTTDPGFKAAASEVGKWMKQSGATFGKVARKDLANTSKMAVLQASATVNTINRSGFFLNPAEAAKTPLTRARVLIIEDDDMQVAVLRSILDREGHAIEVAQRKAEILAALNREPAPDLLLLDVDLPDTNGFAILEKIRQHPVLKKCRVVMVTGRTDRADIAKGVLLGVDGYITKPYSPATLIAAVRQTLGHS